jgi:hypothetical protein
MDKRQMEDIIHVKTKSLKRGALHSQ